MSGGEHSKQRPVVIRNRDRGTVLADTALSAGDSETRRRGLLGRERFETGEALWIAPCEAVHTGWMRFAIDVVFLSRDKRVLKIRHALPPWRIALCLRADSVLELPAGVAQATGTQMGDQLEFDRGDAEA